MSVGVEDVLTADEDEDAIETGAFATSTGKLTSMVFDTVVACACDEENVVVSGVGSINRARFWSCWEDELLLLLLLSPSIFKKII